MGYTHYWYVTKTVKAPTWKLICSAAKQVFERCGVPLARGDGKPGSAPEITDDEIVFNGVDNSATGGEDHSYETCALPRISRQADHLPKSSRGFGFCKTQYQPYDKVVCAVLALAEYLSDGAIKVSSDGNAGDWREGMALAKSVHEGCTLPAELRGGSAEA